MLLSLNARKYFLTFLPVVAPRVAPRVATALMRGQGRKQHGLSRDDTGVPSGQSRRESDSWKMLRNATSATSRLVGWSLVTRSFDDWSHLSNVEAHLFKQTKQTGHAQR